MLPLSTPVNPGQRYIWTSVNPANNIEILVTQTVADPDGIRWVESKDVATGILSWDSEHLFKAICSLVEKC